MANSNIKFDERVVYAGLQRMTNDRAVRQQGFQHWSRTLSDSPFDIIRIVNQLESFLDLHTDEKKRLMVALHSASNRVLEDLDPLPGYIRESALSSGSETAGQQVVKQAPPLIQATEQYCIEFTKRFVRQNPSTVDEFKQALKSETQLTNQSTNKALVKFAESGFTQIELSHQIDSAEAQTIVSTLYMLAVDFVGPMETDRIQYNTIDRLLGMDFASRFDPRDLI